MSVMRVRPTEAVLGAKVEGVDLRALDSGTFATIHRAWLDYQVLLFRDQELTDEHLVAFSRRFGSLDEAPVQETGQRFVEGHPEIYVVSNVVQGGVAIGSLGSGEAVWHTDMSYLPDPPKASALYALEVPPRGGDTSFCSMYAAWDELPDPLQRAAPDVTASPLMRHGPAARCKVVGVASVNRVPGAAPSPRRGRACRSPR